MMIASCFLGAALVVASPTNAPARFSTEAEQTFPIPDVTERNVWLDCGRMTVRDGNGNELHSDDVSEGTSFSSAW